jgi:hypothetical protein
MTHRRGLVGIYHIERRICRCIHRIYLVCSRESAQILIGVVGENLELTLCIGVLFSPEHSLSCLYLGCITNDDHNPNITEERLIKFLYGFFGSLLDVSSFNDLKSLKQAEEGSDF